MAVGITTLALTFTALVAFAANSLLTRLALGAGEIEAAEFTSLRLGAGAIVLVVVVLLRTGTWRSLRGRGVTGPLALLTYAAPFSFAYLRIGAAVGSLVLFGVVQLTMIGYGIFRGERPSAATWTGVALAIGGLAILTVPAASRPSPLGVALMTTAGVGWAIYTLVGRRTTDPIAANARSFLWSTPPAVVLAWLMHGPTAASGRGITLALLSGALTSGVGYAIWYRALPRLSITQAAVAQLSVPVMAGIGAAGLLNERLTARLLLAALAVLSGIGLVVMARVRSRG